MTLTAVAERLAVEQSLLVSTTAGYRTLETFRMRGERSNRLRNRRGPKHMKT